MRLNAWRDEGAARDDCSSERPPHVVSFDLICGTTIGRDLVLKDNTFTNFFAGCIPGTGPGNVIGNNLIVDNNTGGMLQINDEQIGRQPRAHQQPRHRPLGC